MRHHSISKFVSLVLGASASILSMAWASPSHAAVFGGVDFPQGISSFADQVIRFDPLFNGGPEATDSNFTDPNQALGAPNYSSPVGSVSLGRGGLLELGFTDNLLTNSGNSDFDLYVFEVGEVEDTYIAIRPNAATLPLLDPADDLNSDGFWEIGKIFGSTSSLDIDALFPGFTPGQLAFDAVQLIDDPNEGQSAGSTVGADIDAVGAITSVPNTAIPTPALLPGLLSLGLATLRRHQQHTSKDRAS